jgi:hypothetical protein
MIRFDDIISQVKQKRRQRRQIPVDNVDTFHNTPVLIEKTTSQAGEKTLFGPPDTNKTPAKLTSIINDIEKTPTMSLARKEGKINRNVFFTNIPMENSKNINTYARANDNVDVFKSTGKCLGIECNHSGHKTMDDDCLFLWCGKLNQPVIDIVRCPDSFWKKDEQGRPLREI